MANAGAVPPPYPTTPPATGVTGLHHVTVIAGDPQQTLDFYVGVLGLRLVKRTVNQDAPDTYHFFFADGAGTPGSEVTFFPWPTMPPGRRGAGLTNEVALAVPPGSLAYWADRLRAVGVSAGARVTRFGAATLPFEDPHGLALALVESDALDDAARGFAPWAASPVPADRQVRGLHAVRLVTGAPAATARFLEEALGLAPAGEEDGWHRFAVPNAPGASGGTGASGRIVDVRAAGETGRGAWGVGAVHHVAFRVPDDAAELAARRRIGAAGGHTTDVIDRFWFHSIYFREPGGALFEVATDGPGFAVDEDPAALGEQLILPPFLEPRRAEIERVLPPVTVPRPTPAGAAPSGAGVPATDA
ncbi:MAG TPA: ring-cleaving dioxygenase [Gemmatirosa sp.]